MNERTMLNPLQPHGGEREEALRAFLRHAMKRNREEIDGSWLRGFAACLEFQCMLETPEMATLCNRDPSIDDEHRREHVYQLLGVFEALIHET